MISRSCCSMLCPPSPGLGRRPVIQLTRLCRRWERGDLWPTHACVTMNALAASSWLRPGLFRRRPAWLHSKRRASTALIAINAQQHLAPGWRAWHATARGGSNPQRPARVIFRVTAHLLPCPALPCPACCADRNTDREDTCESHAPADWAAAAGVGQAGCMPCVGM